MDSLPPRAMLSCVEHHYSALARHRGEWDPCVLPLSMHASSEQPARPATPGPNATDEALVLAMARGDQEALGWLYDRYASLLLTTAIRFLKNLPQAEDLVHDVLMEAWSKADDYCRGRGTVRTWLLVRLRSRALDRLRRARRAPVDSHPNPQTRRRGSTSEGDPVRSAERAQVRTAVAELPEGQRTVLELAYFGGLTSAEIAAQLNIPIGTVKSRTAAGLSKLRRVMQPGDRRRA